MTLKMSISYKCDKCEHEADPTKPLPDNWFQLKRPDRSQAPLHFCTIRCLVDWLTPQLHVLDVNTIVLRKENEI